MDLEVVWSPEALEDLNSIAQYIARDSKHYAKAVVTKVLDTARTLSEFPRAGRVVPEVGEDTLRESLIYSYRIIYRLHEQHILVLAVIHGKRLLESIGKRLSK